MKWYGVATFTRQDNKKKKFPDLSEDHFKTCLFRTSQK